MASLYNILFEGRQPLVEFHDVDRQPVYDNFCRAVASLATRGWLLHLLDIWGDPPRHDLLSSGRIMAFDDDPGGLVIHPGQQFGPPALQGDPNVLVRPWVPDLDSYQPTGRRYGCLGLDLEADHPHAYFVDTVSGLPPDVVETVRNAWQSPPTVAQL